MVVSRELGAKASPVKLFILRLTHWVVRGFLMAPINYNPVPALSL